jgi:diguanylate cyclase (GGDEF)-like protein
MIILTIFLIAIFTFLQVNNQLKTLTQHNIFRTKLSGMLTKTILENTLLETQEIQQQPAALYKTLSTLKESGIVENITIINQDGQVVASTDKYSRNLKLTPKEQYILQTLFKSKGPTTQYQSHIDKQKNQILQYIPITQVNPSPSQMSDNKDIAYIAKISSSLGNINDALKQVYIPCILISIIIILGNIFLSIALSKTVIGPLKILNKATKEIAGGNLNLRVNLPTGDEIEEVAGTFNDMTAALVRMKERAENANPLTKLPGNNVIHEEIEKRLKEKRKFVVVYSDLDNFKAFNDKYGIGAGDQAIKLTAAIMQESLKFGNPDDFLGHEGGDDFVLLTTPEKAEQVTKHITTEFDKRIRPLYSQEDLERGYIISKSRENEIKQFPIMTISLAGVSNINQPLVNYGQITNICASVKKLAKKITGSVFVLDKISEGVQNEIQH